MEPAEVMQADDNPYPSADQVARAIVAACREMGADPIRLATLGRWTNDRVTGRARILAGIALARTFSCGTTAVGRMIGAANPGSYVSTQRWMIEKGKLAWWDEARCERVIRAIGSKPVSDQASPPVRAAVPCPSAVPVRGPDESIAAFARRAVPADVSTYQTFRRAQRNMQDVTALLMGDPSPDRSALAEHHNRA